MDASDDKKTHESDFCVKCGRKLLDAESKKLGIGPECRKKDPSIKKEISKEGKVYFTRTVHRCFICDKVFTQDQVKMKMINCKEKWICLECDKKANP